MSGLRTPITDVYGERASVPALSARQGEVVRIADQPLAAGSTLVARMPKGTQAVELSIENTGVAAARVSFIAREEDSDATDDATAIAAALHRRVPSGAQMIEFRALVEGDRFVVAAEQAVTVTIHAHRGPV